MGDTEWERAKTREEREKERVREEERREEEGREEKGGTEERGRGGERKKEEEREGERERGKEGKRGERETGWEIGWEMSNGRKREDGRGVVWRERVRGREEAAKMGCSRLRKERENVGILWGKPEILMTRLK